MALTNLVSPRTLVYLSIFLCILVDIRLSEEVTYTLDGEVPSIDTVIAFDQHSIYKRSTGNESTTDASVTSDGGAFPQTTPAPVTTKAPTTANPPMTTKAPSTSAPSGSGNATDSPQTNATAPAFQIIKDSHKYYESEILPPEYVDDHWVEQKNAQRHQTLSDNYRVAVSVQMNFKFRFYGHEINSVTIATGGFLYMSPFLHKWLTATQYIAPLMGNFDTTLGNTSEILYTDYNDAFIVEWSNIYLQDQNHTHPFLFQTHLYENGTIKFIYKKLPLAIKEINRANHPVKIGLSDAYYIDSSVNGKNRRTIYEYHRVAVDLSKIREGSVVIFHPLKTCNLLTDCDTCITDDLSFNCKWCGAVKRCSDGVDWHRQSWRDNGCIQKAHDNVTLCEETSTNTTNTTLQPSTLVSTTAPSVITTGGTTLTTTPVVTTAPVVTTSQKVVTTVTTASPVSTYSRHIICDKAGNSNCEMPEEVNPIGPIIAVIVILLLLLIGGIGGWVFYAYRNPQSASGMWLMEHRPSQMKQKMAKMKFWKKTTSTGEKYEIRSEAEA